MEIYRDMLEKLKYHKQLIMNAFIRKNYYPSNEEITAALNQINARLSLFEAYISKPGAYLNTTEINYCFEMIYKDIEILYKVLEMILTNEFAELKMYIEATLIELETKASHFAKRSNEEANSTSLGTTILFKSDNWNITTEDQATIIDLGEHKFVEGTTIACFANINEIEKDSVVFKFNAQDFNDNIIALPYNLYEDVTYKIPGELSVNKYETKLASYSIVNDVLKLDYEINPVNVYKMVAGKGLMSVTSKRTGRTTLVEFPDISKYNYLATEDCFIEFYIVDGDANDNSLLEYNFNMAPTHCNFSLQDGAIKIDSDVKRIYIDAQMGLLVSFRLEHGTCYSECVEPVIIDNSSILFTGNQAVKDIMMREYVRTDMVKYNIQVYIDSVVDVTNSVESIYIKELS